MPLLGDNLLPEAAVSQRRSMRTRLRNLRDPVRQFRENNIPGPDVVGNIEDRFIDRRDRFVASDNVLSRLRDLRGGGNGGNGSSNGNGGSNGSSNSGSPNGSGSRRSQANNPTLQ